MKSNRKKSLCDPRSNLILYAYVQRKLLNDDLLLASIIKSYHLISIIEWSICRVELEVTYVYLAIKLPR